MLNQDEMAPLKEAMARLERAIGNHREQIAILTKKKEALRVAMDVARSSDAEIVVMGPLRLRSASRGEIDEACIDALRATGRSMAIGEIERALLKSDVAASRTTLRRILEANPRVQRAGDRSAARYTLAEPSGKT